MRKIAITLSLLALVACKDKNQEDTSIKEEQKTEQDTSIVEEISSKITNTEPVVLSLEQAEKLVKMPLACLQQEFPNKLGQTLASEKDLKNPKELHPAFYGCFDWHSSVHAHWSLVSFLKQFPNLAKAEEMKDLLKANLSKENIQQEVRYFKAAQNKTYERTYGWAWLLKLAQEIHTWEDPMAVELEANLQPLTNLIVSNFQEFLPKLNYPIRTGEHDNTAFAMGFAYDYAVATENEKLQALISARAKDFYLSDDDCPISWEPSGFDFLSPCLQELHLMQNVLAEQTFKLWLKDFMPKINNRDFALKVGEVSDRKDGKLVHLDGLNFSRAAVLFNLAGKYEGFAHLKPIAEEHLAYSFSNVLNDSYEGGHWLTTFALYAHNQRVNK
ncbi:DUF2891 domain-containing protein [Mesonia sp. MT50]|uniref:DUF2891 domain-containing protein n=1 Tax=Mesonia profundi TaxID=3070998 RepID=A0ABU1A3H3_9FLAO|nr:DUF2891 domain-containing protein [Mesonia profundi]MDQ7917811.1 DUF2891 domain-containing protein [Mesonia profundi]